MASESWRQQLITNRGLQSGLRSNLLAGAAGDDAVPGDGDLTEDGEGVARDERELGVTELRVRHKLGKPSVITGKILLECVLTPAPVKPLASNPVLVIRKSRSDQKIAVTRLI